MTTSKASITACTNCGLCNTVDPILAITKKETASTRFKAVLAKSGATSPLFFLMADVGMQESVCPANIDLTEAFRFARAQNAKAGVTTSANEEMRKNFATNGTPYTSLAQEEYHDKPVW